MSVETQDELLSISLLQELIDYKQGSRALPEWSGDVYDDEYGLLGVSIQTNYLEEGDFRNGCFLTLAIHQLDPDKPGGFESWSFAEHGWGLHISLIGGVDGSVITSKLHRLEEIEKLHHFRQPPAALTLIYREAKSIPGIILASDVNIKKSEFDKDIFGSVPAAIDSITRFTAVLKRFIKPLNQSEA